MTDELRLDWVPYEHPDAVSLRDSMVAEVSALYGSQRDSGGGTGAGIEPGSVVLTIVGYRGDQPVAHALLRTWGPDLEIKRMFVTPEVRGLGVADALIVALEEGARSLGAVRLVLHTGERQLAAIRTYRRHGFTPIEVYGPYVDMPESLCFAKPLGSGQTRLSSGD